MLGGHIQAAQVVLPCPDLAATLTFLTDRLGFKVDTILPADAPTTAIVSGHGVSLRLEQRADAAPTPVCLRLLCDTDALPDDAARELIAPGGIRIGLADARPGIEVPEGTPELVLSRMSAADAWGVGRAGMQYRDLIPSRWGGRFVASHIRIPDGGEVPDYVHFHRIRFQMIFCKAGWARLVYEDQGDPFLFAAGDCVLQPPEIRHRVLEASAGFEVIEIGCPAVHETIADHALTLPTPHVRPQRDFGGQRFVRHVAADAPWRSWRALGMEARDTGIQAATRGLAGAKVVRSRAREAQRTLSAAHRGEFLFLFVLEGVLGLETAELGDHRLEAGDACAIPGHLEYALCLEPGLELLEVTLPGALPHADTRLMA